MTKLQILHREIANIDAQAQHSNEHSRTTRVMLQTIRVLLDYEYARAEQEEQAAARRAREEECSISGSGSDSNDRGLRRSGEPHDH